LAPLKEGKKYAALFAGRILRMIYGPMNNNGIWRMMHIIMSFISFTMNFIVKLIT